MPFYHFSIDDVFISLMEVSDKRISLFEHPFFDFLRQMHKDFDTNTDLYVFYRQKLNGIMRTLTEVCESLKSDFTENSWLRLGPHSLDEGTPPYTQSLGDQVKIVNSLCAEIERFAGINALSKWLRLHHFSEQYELAEQFHARGIQVLLSTDKEATSYCLPADRRDHLKANGIVNYRGMTFVRSHLRIETLVGRGISPNQGCKILESLFTIPGWAVIFTHESEVSRPEVRAMTKALLSFCKERGVYSL